MTLLGTIDVRGGRGGEVSYYKGSYNQSGRIGSFGGHASSGRIRLEGPNLGTTTTQILAGMHLNTIAAGTLNGGTGALGSFPSSTTINIDAITKDANGFMNFTTMNIAAGQTITLTGNAPAKMRFTGGVTISGVLRSNGAVASNGQYQSNGFYVLTAAPGGVGGSVGGIPNTSSSGGLTDGGSGAGTGGGLGGKKSGKYARAYSYWGYEYYFYPGGGGGGSNLLNYPGTPGGRCRYGATYYSTGAGGLQGTGTTTPSALAATGMTGGTGGGAGANGYYYGYSGSWTNTYSYGGGGGGGGGGAIAIETSSAFTLNGKIELKGGDGGYAYTLNGGGGGAGGSGGNVLVRASSITFAAANAGIDTTGGIGRTAYNSINYEMHNWGGNGGRGAARLEVVTAPSDFVNYGGMPGYSTTTGSFSSAFFTSGDKGISTWQTAAGLGPDFNNGAVTKNGNVLVRIEGAHAHPITGMADTSLTFLQDISATPLSGGLGAPDAVDGLKYFRLNILLQPPSVAVPALPEVDSVSFDVTTK
jgi:hypothetical protein